jgi:hypothetical protein
VENIESLMNSLKCPVCGNSPTITYQVDERNAYKEVQVFVCGCTKDFNQQISSVIRNSQYKVNDIQFKQRNHPFT